MTRYAQEILACSLLLLLTWLPLAQVLDHDFVNFDDNVYVTQNMDVQAGLNSDSVWWAMTETRRSSHWHPVTWLSLLLDYEWHGMMPRGYHLTNLLLHAANVLLLFALLRWATGALWRSGVVAGLFAVHPLHVESVAWISERKDVLSTFFWLLTSLAYLFYCRQPRRDRYWLVLISYGLGLMAKPMLVTLPCTLLLLDYWPLRRFAFAQEEGRMQGTFPVVSPKWLVLEKVPLLVMAAATSIVTLLAMGSAATLRSLDRISVSERIGNALTAYVMYLWKMVWPRDLAPYYPLGTAERPLIQILGSALVLGGFTVVAAVQFRRRTYLLVGWLWYLGTLLPVIGLVQVGSQAMADRYTYVPLIGIFVLLVWGSADLAPSRWARWLVPGWTGILAACAVCTYFQAGIWRNSVTLWTHTLAATNDNYLAHTNLAMDLQNTGRRAEAIVHFREAVAILPDYPRAYLNLGNAYRNSGQPEETLKVWCAMVERWPEAAEYRYNLAAVLRELGQNEGADREEAEGERRAQARKLHSGHP
jgi:hypothetical protein